MKFTLSWLKNFLQTELSASQIAEKLTSLGLEVEEVTDLAESYRDLKVAQIESTSPHPDAERLQVCKVNDGTQILQIVCGASNARAGLKVVLAPVGCQVPNGLLIKEAKIRGVDSCGMLCSKSELMLGDDHSGIMELSASAQIGQDFAKYAELNEEIIEVSLTPNRGDAASVYGLARDLAAGDVGKLLPLPEVKIEAQAGRLVEVKNIAVKDCQEFWLRGITSLEVQGVARNITCYLKNVSNVNVNDLVNISNFAMLSYGRPNHIYDADKIRGSVEVRYSKAQEAFIALGGQEYKLPAGLLVIADEEKILAVAGVIGGELSKVDENTKNILIEVANFSPLAVTESGRKLGIITDSRFRFERRIDPANTEFFMNFLTNLILNHCGGGNTKVHETAITYGESMSYIQEIKFDVAEVRNLAGIDISAQVAHSILNRLGFKVEAGVVKVPSWRQGEVEAGPDLVEEIARVYGYDNIPLAKVEYSAKLRSTSSAQQAVLALRHLGMCEVISWSFISQELATLAGEQDALELANPISAEMKIMRPSIIPNLLKIAKHNIDYGQLNAGFFERGLIYNHQLPAYQSQCIAGLRYGDVEHRSVHKDERPCDFFDAKTLAFAVVEAYGFNPTGSMLTKEAPSYYHPGRSCALKLGKTTIGFVGQIHPQVLNAVGLDKFTDNIVGFEIFPEHIPVAKKRTVKAVELYDYQPVVRDFAFLLDNSITAESICQTIGKVDKDYIEEVRIFDVYQGKGVPEGKKSVAISVRMQPKKETMSEAQIKAVCEKVTQAINQRFGGELRGNVVA
jgi:phenylalanyl-tRNA synthetase beta chain